MPEQSAIRADPSVWAFYFENSCILFSEASQKAFSFNATAGVVWSLLQDGSDLPGVVAALRGAFSVDPDDAPVFAQDAVVQFREHGLLLGAGAQEDHVLEVASRAARLPTGPFAMERSYELAGCRMRLRYAAAEHAGIFHQAVGHLSASGSAPASVTIDVLCGPAGITILRDDVPTGACVSADELAPILKGLLWSEAVHHSDFLFGFHAGAIAADSGALLLPGQSGSGKSTLTAMLVAAGCEYLSDEMALLEEETLRVKPLPLAMCVKRSGISVLAPLFPVLKTLPVHHRADGKQVVYMPPPHVTERAKPRDVKAIVFPTFREGADVLLAPMPADEAVGRMLSECLVAGRVLRREHIAQLIDWLVTKPCFKLDFGSSAEAVPVLLSLVDFSPRATNSAT